MNLPMMDKFFAIGDKVTNGDPVRKAQFDYYLYWIVFLAIFFLALNYYYQFFWKGYSLSSLMWALIMTAFSWFNYFALKMFHMNYTMLKGLKSPKENVAWEDVVDEFEKAQN